MCHRLPNGSIKRILVHHGFIYIRNQARYNDVGFIEIAAWAKLITGEYIDIRARAARQLTTADGNRYITLVSNDSSVEALKIDSALSTTHAAIHVDSNTITGDGSTTAPIAVKIPYTQAEKDKLTALPANAQPNPTIGDVITAMEAQAPADKLSYDTGLKDKPTLDIPNDLNDLDDVTITNPVDNQVLTYDTDKFKNLPAHETQLSYPQIEGVLRTHKLPRDLLSGDTTVQGGTTLPSVANVDNFTLRVRQSNNADNPALYLTSATYDTPVRDRNRVVLSVDGNGLFSINPQRGSTTDNYDNFVGTYSARARAGTGQVTIALYDDPHPPTTIYIRGIGGNTNPFAVTRSGPGFINGRTYSVYSATIAASVVQNAPNTTQTLTFFTDAAGATPWNIKPATEHHARAWHLQSPVNSDYSVTDNRSPAFIKNKPTPSTIGKLVAVTATLPTTATAFSTSATIARYTPTLTTTGVDITTGYTVASNSIVADVSYNDAMLGWWLQSLTGDTVTARLFIPLTPQVAYSNTASILADTRACAHAHMGVSAGINYYLAYQVHSGNQATIHASGHTDTNIEVLVAINQTTGNVSFPANSKIEIREAVIVDK